MILTRKTVIHITDLAVTEVRLGVYPEEKQSSTSILLSVSLRLKTQHRELSDQLEDTIDYTKVVELVKWCAHQRHFNLIETLGEFVASSLLENFGNAAAVRVKISKPSGLTQGTPTATLILSRRSGRPGKKHPSHL